MKTRANRQTGRTSRHAPHLETLEARRLLVLGVYHGYDDLTDELADYAAAYPDIAQLTSIGRSVQGRELWAMKISDNLQVEEDEPEVKYVSTMHGDEPVGTEMSLYFIDQLLTGYGSDPRITDFVDETEVWVVPLMNPDGRESGRRANAQGYDLNRSFPEGATTPIGTIFDGPSMNTAGRPPEVVSVMQWSAEQSFVLSANLHTGALVVNYPYDNDGRGSTYSASPDDALFIHVAETYSVHNRPMWNSSVFNNGIVNGADWYSITGGMQDWNYRYLGTNEMTIELSDNKWPAQGTLPSYWNDNRESMLAYLESAHMGIRGVASDALTGEPVYAKVLVRGNPQPVFSDPDVGDFHRMLLPGSYTLTFDAPGYVSQTIENIVVNAASATRLDVSMVPEDHVSPQIVSVNLNAGLQDPPDLDVAQPTSWQQQRSQLQTIEIQFSEPMHWTERDIEQLQLVNLGVDAPVEADYAYDLTDALVTMIDPDTLQITLGDNRMADGLYELRVLPGMTDLSGNPLDGDGDGAGGDAYVLRGTAANRFYQLTGDWNGDGGASIFDFATYAYWFGLSSPEAPRYVDLNGDGGISIYDFSPFAIRFGQNIVVDSPAARPDASPDSAAAIPVVSPLLPRDAGQRTEDDSLLARQGDTPLVGSLAKSTDRERVQEAALLTWLTDWTDRRQVRDAKFDAL